MDNNEFSLVKQNKILANKEIEITKNDDIFLIIK